MDTKIFHATIKEKQRRKHIKQIVLDVGCILSSAQEIHDDTIEFF